MNIRSLAEAACAESASGSYRNHEFPLDPACTCTDVLCTQLYIYPGTMNSRSTGYSRPRLQVQLYSCPGSCTTGTRSSSRIPTTSILIRKTLEIVLNALSFTVIVLHVQL